MAFTATEPELLCIVADKDDSLRRIYGMRAHKAIVDPAFLHQKTSPIAVIQLIIGSHLITTVWSFTPKGGSGIEVTGSYLLFAPR